MENKIIPESQEEIYFYKFLNKIERAVGWFFFVTGLIILASYGLYEFVLALLRDTQLNIVFKVGIFFVIIGFVILLFSIIREKIILSRTDKYRKVEK